MDWLRIIGPIIKLLNSVLTIFTTTGSEPATGDVDTIENSNKLIYDEISLLDRVITYPIPVEYRTCYDAKVWYNEETNYSVGGKSKTRYWSTYITNYNDTAAILFSDKKIYGSDKNIDYAYIYLYDTDDEIRIQCLWKDYPVKFEYDGNFNIYVVDSTVYNTYTKYIFDIAGTLISKEGISGVFSASQMTARSGTNSSVLSLSVLPFSCVNLYAPETFRFYPQEINGEYFVGLGDKGYYFNYDYKNTRIVFFNEPLLIGHGLVPNYKHNIKIVGDSYYRTNQYGKIERFKL